MAAHPLDKYLVKIGACRGILLDDLERDPGLAALVDEFRDRFENKRFLLFIESDAHGKPPPPEPIPYKIKGIGKGRQK